MDMFTTARFENLHELFVGKLQALYDAEKQIVESLPLMIDNASNAALRNALETHLEETRNQITRLERAMESIGAEVRESTSDGMRGIIKEGAWVMEHASTKEAGDAGIIAAAQNVEHYEIANYGSAAEWADLMGHTEASRLLKETLAEEEATDEILSQLAESEINQEANKLVLA